MLASPDALDAVIAAFAAIAAEQGGCLPVFLWMGSSPY
jgi:hypothetical protein